MEDLRSVVRHHAVWTLHRNSHQAVEVGRITECLCTCVVTGWCILIFGRLPSCPSPFMLPLNESSFWAIYNADSCMLTWTCFWYTQETIYYASLLTRPVTRQMNIETKLSRPLATEILLRTHRCVLDIHPSHSLLLTYTHSQTLVKDMHFL